jgi:hypothetical protein
MSYLGHVPIGGLRSKNQLPNYNRISNIQITYFYEEQSQIDANEIYQKVNNIVNTKMGLFRDDQITLVGRVLQKGSPSLFSDSDTFSLDSSKLMAYFDTSLET